MAVQTLPEPQAGLRRALERAASEWRSTFDALGLPIVIVDFGGTVRRINRAAQALLGGDYRDIIGRPVTELGAGQPWAGLAALVHRLLRSTEPSACETRDEGGSTWELEACLSGGPAPEDARVIVQVRDITRTVRLQESLRRSETMAVLGGIVGGLAHEVRNPLLGIMAALDAFEARHGDRAEYRQYMPLLRTEVARLLELMQPLLDYGQPARLASLPGEIGDAVTGALRASRPLAAGRDVGLVTGLAGGGQPLLLPAPPPAPGGGERGGPRGRRRDTASPLRPARPAPLAPAAPIPGERRPGQSGIDPFLGASPAVRAYAREAALALRSEGPILIQGETGSGKGVLARWLREHGPRREEALVDLNCAGLSRDFLESELFGHARGAFTGAVAAKQGLFEAAHGGTLFLDEIGDLDPAVQPKVLKALEEKRFRRLGEVDDRRVDVLLIAATNHDLPGLVREGRFRSDLFFRISTIPIAVPPLRDRLDDLPVLAASLLGELGRELARPHLTLLPEALAALQSYAWPGNLRELRNVLERAALRSESGALGRADLQFAAGLSHGPAVPSGPTGSNVSTVSTLASIEPTLAEAERSQIEKILKEEHGRVVTAARRLGIPRSTLYQKIRELHINLAQLKA